MTPDETPNIRPAVAPLIDHTLLKPEATAADVERVCREATEYRFATVCVNPCWVDTAARLLEGSPVRVCTVVGFPLGANETATKIAEAELALSRGAQELDMVQNVGALRGGAIGFVEAETAKLAEVAHNAGAILKVILETSLLNDEQKAAACRAAAAGQADFVKTSTGFSGAGATAEDVRLMRQTVGDALGVKASGGIRTLTALMDMVRAGANRIGTSSGIAILHEAGQRVDSGAAKTTANQRTQAGQY